MIIPMEKLTIREERDYYKNKYFEEIIKRGELESKLKDFFGWIFYDILKINNENE